MKPNSTKFLATLLFGASLLLTALTATAQSGESVAVNSVDNYGGNSNVHTSRPNTTLTVTELDADKKPVRSWTGTTDSNSRITIPAGSNLSVPYLRARVADPKMAEFVIPSEIMQSEPFLFSAPTVLSGTVVDVKNLHGEVVDTRKTDRYGRVYLAAGLAAGSYLVTAGSDLSKSVATIHVAPQIHDPFGCAVKGLSIDENLPPLDLAKFGTMSGNYPNPGSLEMDGGPSLREPVIRAATTRQLIVGKPTDLGLKPGEVALHLKDTQTSQTADAERVLYSSKARLTQVKVLAGSETHLVVTVEPKEFEADVVARILSGPVTFGDGQGSMSLSFTKGIADFRVQSKPGETGPFEVDVEVKPKKYKSHLWVPKKYKWFLWEPKKEKLVSHLWEPPKTESVNDAGAEAEKPAPRGGDTKAGPPVWEPFEEKDEYGKVRKGKRLVEFGGGTRTEKKVYDDGGTELKKTEETTHPDTKAVTKTETTDTTVPASRGSGTRTETTETTKSTKDGDTWIEESRERTIREFKDGKLVGETKEVYVKGKGWKPKK